MPNQQCHEDDHTGSVYAKPEFPHLSPHQYLIKNKDDNDPDRDQDKPEQIEIGSCLLHLDLLRNSQREGKSLVYFYVKDLF